MSGGRILPRRSILSFHLRQLQSERNVGNQVTDADTRDAQRPASTRRWRSSAGFTLIDLLFAIAIIGILSAIAIPSLLRGRAAANEASAIASMRSTHTAQLSYMLTCGIGFYASSFTALGGGPGGLGFLPTDLTYSTTPSKSGYTMTMSTGIAGVLGPADCNGSPDTSLTYYATAIPQTPGSTGIRGFATNQAGAIWEDVSGAAPVEPFSHLPGISPVD